MVPITLILSVLFFAGCSDDKKEKEDLACRLDREIVYSYTAAHETSCRVVKEGFIQTGEDGTVISNGRYVKKAWITQDWECADGKSIKTKF